MEYGLFMLAAAYSWANYGYIGLFAGSFLSALFIPIGADILYVILLSRDFDPWVCLFIATTGGWSGGLVIYAIGYAGNTRKIKKLLRIKESQLIRQKVRIEKYGSLMALFVWLPVIGDISNVALGFYRTHRTKTFILMYIGRMFRFLLWTVLYLIYTNRFVNFFDKL